MIKQISKYPSIIARPYIRASKKDAQWKDNQRYTFESLVTVLASYAVSDLLNVYMTLREPVESGEGDISEEDLEIIESLKNIENLKLDEDDYFFHAGTKKINNKVYSNGGRVINFVSLSSNFKNSRDKAISLIKNLNWKDGFYRKDIGHKVIDE